MIYESTLRTTNCTNFTNSRFDELQKIIPYPFASWRISGLSLFRVGSFHSESHELHEFHKFKI